MPTGACNFINLNIAGNVRCGCQRYFDKSVTLRGRTTDGQEQEVSYWCMCEHHACYHGAERKEMPVEEVRSIMPSQELPMVSVHGDTELPDTAVGTRPPSIVGRSQASYRRMNGAAVGGNGRITLPTAQPLPQAPRATSRSTQRHESLHVPELPDIPSQCFLPSNISSGSAAAVSRNASFNQNQDAAANIRASNHLSSIHDWIPDPVQPYYFPESVTDCASLMSRYVDNDIPQTNFGVPQREQQQHVTSVPTEQERAPPTRTASRQSSRVTRSQSQHMRNTTLVIRPSGSQEAHPNKMELDSPSATSVDLRSILPHIPEIREHYAARPTLKDKLQNHEDRLDHLENQTHSVACATESDRNCDCDCDLVSSRVDRHDTRVGKIERALSARKFKGFAQLEDGEHSFVSEATTDISASHAELYNRVDSRMGDLESRMSKLDGSITLPSASNPWEFEVVFLPFGAELAKVWSSGESFGSQMSRRSSNQDLTHSNQFVPNTEASATKFFTKAPRENSWEHTLEEAYVKNGILSARACSIDSLIDQRLRSRGLVRSIEVKGPDAQHVQFAIFEAFGDLLQTMADGPPRMPKLSSKVPKKLRRFKEALNSSWIPLRKLHKDSKLRFLEASEMITSSLWTPSFLSEVAMQQSGRRRLFTTGRESYIQHSNNLLSGSGWTWESIRQLTPFDPDASQVEDYEFHHTPSRNTAMVLSEPCWEHDDKLDTSKQLELPDLAISATHQTTTTAPQSHLQFPLSVQDSFSISASFHSVERSDNDEPSSSVANSSSSIASSPAPSATSLRFSNSPVPISRQSRKVSDSISPLTSRNAFENINITTRSGHRRGIRSRTGSASYSATPSQTPGAEAPFGLEMARKRGNPYSSIFEDAKPRRSYPMSSSPAKATTSNNYLNIKRQRTRSPSRPRDMPRWSVGRSSPSPFIFEDRSRSNTREATAGLVNMVREGEGERKRGLTPFAYATPFSNAPVIVKRERSWGSNAGGGLGNVAPWNDQDSDTDEAGTDNDASGYESDFFQPRQVPSTPRGDWDGLPTDNEATLRQGGIDVAAVSSSFGAEAKALSEEEEDEGEVSDAPSEYPSTQVRIEGRDKGKGVVKEPLVDSTEKFVDPKGSGTFEIHED